MRTRGSHTVRVQGVPNPAHPVGSDGYGRRPDRCDRCAVSLGRLLSASPAENGNARGLDPREPPGRRLACPPSNRKRPGRQFGRSGNMGSSWGNLEPLVGPSRRGHLSLFSSLSFLGTSKASRKCDPQNVGRTRLTACCAKDRTSKTRRNC